MSSPLQETLSRAVSGRRWLPAGNRKTRTAAHRHGRVALPALAALAIAMLLSLVGIAAPWTGSTTPALGGGGAAGAGPAPGDHPPQRPGGRDSGPDAAGEPARPSPVEPGGPQPCSPPLAVIASPDIAPLVRELAGPLATGNCPQVTVRAEQPLATIDTATGGGATPDVWVPASSFWLLQASDDNGQTLPTTGTSMARTPITVAIPKPVHQQLAAMGSLPAWAMLYERTIDGTIERMNMANPVTTEGALALLSLEHALLQYSEGDGGLTFLRVLNFREHMANQLADPDALLVRLARTSPSQAGSKVGLFPTTEQAVLAYNRQHPATELVSMIPYDKPIEADYPVAVSPRLSPQLSSVADDLLARLTSAGAAKRLMAAGFRPPTTAPGQPALDPDWFPHYQHPMAIPSDATWQDLVEGWLWTP